MKKTILLAMLLLTASPVAAQGTSIDSVEAIEPARLVAATRLMEVTMPARLQRQWQNRW